MSARGKKAQLHDVGLYKDALRIADKPTQQAILQAAAKDRFIDWDEFDELAAIVFPEFFPA